MLIYNKSAMPVSGGDFYVVKEQVNKYDYWKYNAAYQQNNWSYACSGIHQFKE